jgi:exopolysaccharide biosynthesis polyprenyl glycosylphosphotransferase
MSPRRNALVNLLKVADVVVVATCFLVAVALGVTQYRLGDWLSILEMRISLRNVLFVAAYLFFWHIVLGLRGLYGSYRLSPASRELHDLLIAVTIATAPLLPIGVALGLGAVNPHFLLAFPALALAALAVERRMLRVVASRLRRFGRNLRNVVIVGDDGAALDAAVRLGHREALGYNVVKVLSTGLLSDADTIMARLTAIVDRQPVDEVFFAAPLDGTRPAVAVLIRLCQEMGITVRVITHLTTLGSARASVDLLGSQPVLTIASGPPDSLCLVAKRALDVSLAGLGLLLMAPLVVLIGVAIKLDSRGPVFFAQERVGLNRRRFSMRKFRSMVVDADARQADLEVHNEADGPVFKIERDPRVTRVGRVLRRTSLDELPQLWNVLVGEMSLVGPRPLPLRDVDRMNVRWHQRRFSVKPGITCLWQIRSREPKFDEWIRSDMEYIDNWSLTLDLRILARTLPAVISGQGAS